MTDPQAALLTQLKNIETRTGKPVAALHTALAGAGLSKHGEKRSWLMETFGLGYGDANMLVHLAGKPLPALADGAPPAAVPPAADTHTLDTLYSGNKAHLRPLHEAVMALALSMGRFEQAPKKTYISLRRKKQFAMLGPATKNSVELGLNARELPPHPRLKVLAPGGMCKATVRISRLDEVDAALKSWLQQSFDEAG